MAQSPKPKATLATPNANQEDSNSPAETEQPVIPTSKHVYQAIAQVAAALQKEGISKDNTNTQQKFKFRGIDDVMNAISRQLVDAHLLIIPRCMERTSVLIPRFYDNGKPASPSNMVSVKMEYDFISTIDGSMHTGTMVGEGLDTSDKATNKAVSGAFKYMMLETFCIPTEGEKDQDADNTQIPAPAPQNPVPPAQKPPAAPQNPAPPAQNPPPANTAAAPVKTLRQKSVHELTPAELEQMKADVETAIRTLPECKNVEEIGVLEEGFDTDLNRSTTYREAKAARVAVLTSGDLPF